jgi:hypothetical protein
VVVVVVAVDEDTVLMHDPLGRPFASLPIADFLKAWRAEQLSWIDPPFVMRSDFVRVRDTDIDDALRAALPSAVRSLSDDCDAPVPPGTLGTAEARALGSLQYDLVVGDRIRAAATMRSMAPSCSSLVASLR